jgi:OmcA/MtrC family decaheme c-type cytochrome
MKMKRTLIRLGLAALVSSALFGCGGGSDGVNGATVTVPINVSNAQSVGSNAATPSAAAVAAWQTLQPKVNVLSVSIKGQPVIKFAVTDTNGNALTGLDNYSWNKTSARFASLTNVSFTLAKLVPATGTEPSKWVSYLVTKPTTVAQANPANAIVATEACTDDRQWCGTYPSTDKEGTLTDNKDGTYTYQFLRDITKAARIVASLPDTVDGLKKKAALGDLTFAPGATHRLGIIISGNAPGTGTNTPDASTSTTVAAPMAIAGNIVYDFRPDGGVVTATRSIVDIDSCGSCHNGKILAHGARKDPNLCVTCHTDQIRYGFDVEATRTDSTHLVPTQNTAVIDDRAVGNFPNMLHKIHMGDKLGLKGYYFNKDAAGQFNSVSWIQDPRDCTKCHNGSYDPTAGITDAVALAAANADKLNIAKITKDGDNWKNNPSRLACGACHDDVSFTATEAETIAGTTASGLIAHPGGAASDDSTCGTKCHAGAGATDLVAVLHRAEASTANNPVVATGVSGITYAIKSVSLNSLNQPVVTFKITVDGTKDLQVGDFADPTPFLFQTPVPTGNSSGKPSTGSSGMLNVYTSFNKEFPSNQAIYQPIPGFVGGPTFYVAYAVEQDGITAPADFNTYQSVSLANLLVKNPSITVGGAALGGPNAGKLENDTGGYMKATLTGNLTGQRISTAATTTPATALDCARTTSSNAVGYCVNPSPIVVPSTAKLVTAAMIGNFNQVAFPVGSKLGLKFNQSVRTDSTTTSQYYTTGVSYYENGTTTPGLILKTPLAKTARSTADARRVVVDSAKCESCHEQLGTAVEFHGGARNNPTACAICHNTSKASGGWTANASTFIHGIHAGTSNGNGGAGPTYSKGKRTNPFSWVHSTSYDFGSTVYPGILKRCDNCHVPNAVNFGANGATLQPNLLWPTAAAGIVKDDRTSATAVIPHDTATSSKLVFFPLDNLPTVAGTNYGNVFSYTPVGSVVPRVQVYSASGTVYNSNALAISIAADPVKAPTVGVSVPADVKTLVESPISSACFACHDSNLAQTHMKANGGVIYGPRLDPAGKYSNITSGSLVFTNQETCLVCHGQGRDQDAAVVHSK